MQEIQRKSRKYSDILEATVKLFYKYGFRKVTVEDVCREAKVSKMTFYKFFPNKTELGKVVIDGLFEYWIDKYQEIIDSDISFSDKMKWVLQMKKEANENTSKEFLLNIYNSTDSGSKELTERALIWRAKAIEQTRKLFERGQEKGEIRQDIKMEMILALMDKLTELSGDEKLLDIYESMSDFVYEITAFFLYGIITRE